jgi:two-component system OmpR family response regulator
MNDAHDKPSHGPLKVLCVDDNEDAADTLGEILSIAGHDVAVCHDGASALATVEAGFRPDVAVLDISMPGIDGCQLASALRAERDEDDLLLVAVTALGDYRSLERMADSGFDLHFTKPVMPESLYGVLDERSAQLAANDSRH